MRPSTTSLTPQRLPGTRCRVRTPWQWRIQRATSEAFTTAGLGTARRKRFCGHGADSSKRLQMPALHSLAPRKPKNKPGARALIRSTKDEATAGPGPRGRGPPAPTPATGHTAAVHAPALEEDAPPSPPSEQQQDCCLEISSAKFTKWSSKCSNRFADRQ